MNKFLNYLFFFGSVARNTAGYLKSTAPDFKRLKEANLRDKLIDELETWGQQKIETITNIKKDDV